MAADGERLDGADGAAVHAIAFDTSSHKALDVAAIIDEFDKSLCFDFTWIIAGEVGGCALRLRHLTGKKEQLEQ
ncbi:MAG: hypothetical protein JRG70_20490 [Deltaproteobacteria bacterium]|nr:hypothetical protein [Deltaproteobacteria bacterium]